MDATEYLTLPPEKRKRLAAKRSRERSRARQRGESVPPTIEEELGLKKKKSPEDKAKKAKAKKDDGPKKYFKEDGEEISYEKWRERALNPVLFAAKGEVPMQPRTILGMLHWVKGYDRDEYIGEALDRGFTHRMSYFNGDVEAGTVFFHELTEETAIKLRAVLMASRPTMRILFGDKAELN